MKKLTLDFYEQNSMSSIGISCQLTDYKMLFNINKTLKYQFKKEDNLVINVAKIKGSFSLYFFDDLSNERKIYLLSNNDNGNILISELKQFDYFFIVDSNADDDYMNEIAKKIKGISQVIFTQNIDLEKVKNYDVFCEEFDSHIDTI